MSEADWATKRKQRGGIAFVGDLGAADTLGVQPHFGQW